MRPIISVRIRPQRGSSEIEAKRNGVPMLERFFACKTSRRPSHKSLSLHRRTPRLATSAFARRMERLEERLALSADTFLTINTTYGAFHVELYNTVTPANRVELPVLRQHACVQRFDLSTVDPGLRDPRRRLHVVEHDVFQHVAIHDDCEPGDDRQRSGNPEFHRHVVDGPSPRGRTARPANGSLTWPTIHRSTAPVPADPTPCSAK